MTAGVHQKRVALIDMQAQLGRSGQSTPVRSRARTCGETALALSGFAPESLHGVDLSLGRDATVERFSAARAQRDRGIQHVHPEHLRADHADIFVGSATFIDPHLVQVSGGGEPGNPASGQEYPDRDRIGPRPSYRYFPFDHPGVFPIPTRYSVTSLPKSMAIIGAGVIAGEYACTFCRLWHRMHLVDGRNALPAVLDSEISVALPGIMARTGVTFHWEQRVHTCLPSGRGRADA